MLTTRTFTRRARADPLQLLPVYRTMATNAAPGEQFEVRQTSATEDWHQIHLNQSRWTKLDKL